MKKDLRTKTILQCIEVVSSEPEFPDNPSKELVKKIERLGLVKSMRLAVRATKRCIIDRLSKME